jgi:hypothetical protein
MALTPLERERIAWTDFRLLSSDIREQVFALASDWDVRFKGTVASDLGLFEKDYAAAEQDAQVRYFDEQRQRGLTQARNFGEMAQSLAPQVRRDVEAHMRSRAWRLRKGPYLEYLSLLVTLGQYRPASSASRQLELTTPLSALPLVRRDTGAAHYLWTQPNIPAVVSGMNAEPDLLIANQSNIAPDTVFAIRESKHTRLRAATIRAEFGKAFDLRVRSCVIVSYYRVPLHRLDAARRLGLEVEALELGEREQPVREAGEIARQVKEAFDSADRNARFTEILSTAARESESKELTVWRPRE